MFRKIKLADKVLLLIYDTQRELASTFLRFQEYYESPKFKGKYFTLEEFAKWYVEQKGSFTYYEDWIGFNIPSKILKPFYEGKFDPLSFKEKQLLESLKYEEGVFYLIGIHKEAYDIQNLLKHELAHSFYYTDKNYRERVDAILEKFDLEAVKQALRNTRGYEENVLLDEIQAQSVSGREKLKAALSEDMSNRIKEVFNSVLENKNINIEEIMKN